MTDTALRLACQRVGCPNAFPPTARRGGRGGRVRRYCSNVCAVMANQPSRGSGAHVAWGLPDDARYPVMYVASKTSDDVDALGRPKTVYRFGRTPEEAERRLSEPAKR